MVITVKICFHVATIQYGHHLCRTIDRLAHQSEVKPLFLVAESPLEMGNAKADEEDVGGRRGKGKGRRNKAVAAADADDETEQARPLMVDEDVAAPGEQRSYAHRDIKPGRLFSNVKLGCHDEPHY